MRLPRHSESCLACTLPVSAGMTCCPWCGVRRQRPSRAAWRPLGGHRCGSCDAAVRQDWVACPTCSTELRWSLREATTALGTVLEECGAPALAERVRVKRTRGAAQGYVWARETRVLFVRRDAIDFDRAWIPRMLRLVGFPAFSMSHPLHTVLHECGHVFTNWLPRRKPIDGARVSALFGDFSQPYPTEWRAYSERALERAASGTLRQHISLYGAMHPAEELAECFAVVSYLRASPKRIDGWCEIHRSPPIVKARMRWIASELRQLS